MTGPDHLWAATDFLNPAVMVPVQKHAGKVRTDYDDAQTDTGPVVPYIRSDIDSQVKEITDQELQSAVGLLAALHGLTFGDTGSITTLRQMVADAEDENTTVAHSFDPHTGHA